MRSDIQPYERSFSSKEVAEEAGIATPTVRKYAQILEKNGYEFLKEGDRRSFVQSDIEVLIALRDTDRPLEDAAKELVIQQKDRLKGSTEIEVAIPDTFETLPSDPNQLKEMLSFLANELAATREMNVQISNDLTQLKTTVSRLQQDHHDLGANIRNSAQKTQVKIEKLAQQEKEHYDILLQQEKEKNDFLQKEIQRLRADHDQEWRSQNDFNKRLEVAIHKPKEKQWDWLFSLFRK
ncbi:hypothetical protein SAMN05192533_11436 [Mesobacillus persicus]|uniref:HTH merR-type domain-containing protein n=1 Tax=Mesobacillus persicus TaxID=930146 RepID=A0A1H8GZT2_9BACI|nr:hypothetical protein [Mesobacillus persicus]SEN49486.1 hypothetical protein SAMN05192533_11436 [Mesobacillus persicus]